MVGPGRLELPTSRLSGVRSNHLSYGPILGKAHNQQSIVFKTTGRGSYPCEKEKRGRRHSPYRHDASIYAAYCVRWSPDWCHLCSKKHGKGHVQASQRLVQTVFQFHSFLRKEVIQPQVPLRLPCYDFTPVADPTVVSCLLAVSALPSGRTNSHGVTGGVYKARERIHRSMLICDY